MSETYSIAWGNPYTDPPAGLARVQLATANKAEALALHTWFGFGSGWAFNVHVETRQPDPRRQWSKERKAKTRKRNLRRRIERKHPLFAESIYQEELQKRPGYYAGEDPNPQITPRRAPPC